MQAKKEYNKRLYFSSRTYNLRKWIEKTFCIKEVKSKTTNSYYYQIPLSESKYDDNMTIRISDHYKPSTSLRQFNIFITPDVHNPEHNIYMVSNPGFGNFMYATTEISEVKFDLTRTVGFVRSKFFIKQVEDAHDNVIKLQKLENETSAKKKGQLISNNKFEKLKTSPERAGRYWPTVCKFVPGFDRMSKSERKNVKSLFASKIDFDVACKIVEEANKTNLCGNAYIAKIKELKNNYI